MPLDTIAVPTVTSAPSTTLTTNSAGAVNAVWGNWNIQFVQTTGTNIYTATTASTTNATWVLWNQEMAYELQQAINTASAAMTEIGNQLITATTAITQTLTNTWSAWNIQYTATNANTVNVADYTWDRWNQIRNATPEQVRRAIEHRRPTEEQVRAAQERERQWREAEEKRKREEEEAKVKAELLLRQHLNREQIEDLEKKGCFFLHVGGEKYQIVRGQHGNVRLLDADGKVKRSFCIHPKIRVPDADAMLAQKLLLECDKDSFYRIANITEYGGRGEVLPPVRAANANR